MLISKSHIPLISALGKKQLGWVWQSTTCLSSLFQVILLSNDDTVQTFLTMYTFTSTYNHLDINQSRHDIYGKITLMLALHALENGWQWYKSKCIATLTLVWSFNTQNPHTLVSSAGSIDPVVSLKDGRIRGEYVMVKGTKKRVKQYLAIPFARPPVGPLRLAAPQDTEPWEGERDGTHQPPM